MKPTDRIPRGIEVLVKKASVDAGFKRTLLEKRADAADEIELTLKPSEIAMINAVPAAQLEAIIAGTTVEPKQRSAFLGRVAAVMIVALGASTVGCGSERDEPGTDDGIRPDRPDVEEEEEAEAEEPDREEARKREEANREEDFQTDSFGLRPVRP
jgi:hypothetical protein